MRPILLFWGVVCCLVVVIASKNTSFLVEEDPLLIKEDDEVKIVGSSPDQPAFRLLIFSNLCDGPFSFLCDLWIVLTRILCSIFTELPFGLCSVPDPPTSTCPLLQNPIDSTTECTASPSDSTGTTLPVCIGVRGNGPRVTAHFPAIARVVEILGPISAMAGASSGTWTMFVMDSIQNNPVVVDCPNDTCCGLEEQKARISFLLKSFEIMPGAFNLVDDFLSVIETIVTLDLAALLRSRDSDIVEDAYNTLLSILQGAFTDNEPLINPDFTDFILNANNPIAAAIDLVDSTISLLEFSTDDPKSFVRPGLLNFRRAAEILDRIASFYRGLDPTKLSEMQSITDDCAERSVGLRWRDISSLSTDRGTCGDRFKELFSDFQLARWNNSPSRLGEFIGETGKLTVVGGTTVLVDEAATAWVAAKRAYESDPGAALTFDVDYNDVRFGFFSTEAAMDTISAGMTEFTDLGAQKFLRLAPRTWADFLITSPAEPTLSQGVIIDEGVSVGGFNAQVPAQILTALGCDKIVLINLPGGIGNFTVGLNSLLGASDATIAQLFDLDDPTSSFATSLELQDGTVCADWDTPNTIDFLGLAETGFVGPFYSADSCLLSFSDDVVNGFTRGCTPEATE